MQLENAIKKLSKYGSVQAVRSKSGDSAHYFATVNGLVVSFLWSKSAGVYGYQTLDRPDGNRLIYQNLTRALSEALRRSRMVRVAIPDTCWDVQDSRKKFVIELEVEIFYYGAGLKPIPVARAMKIYGEPECNFVISCWHEIFENIEGGGHFSVRLRGPETQALALAASVIDGTTPAEVLLDWILEHSYPRFQKFHQFLLEEVAARRQKGPGCQPGTWLSRGKLKSASDRAEAK